MFIDQYGNKRKLKQKKTQAQKLSEEQRWKASDLTEHELGRANRDQKHVDLALLIKDYRKKSKSYVGLRKILKAYCMANRLHQFQNIQFTKKEHKQALDLVELYVRHPRSRAKREVQKADQYIEEAIEILGKQFSKVDPIK